MAAFLLASAGCAKSVEGEATTELAESFGSTCRGYACRKAPCPSGAKTTLRGRVYSPAVAEPDAIYGAVVYVPERPPAKPKKGATCSPCGTDLGAIPVALTESDATGEFVLEDVPVGDDVPLVIQVGKWRRTAVIPHVVPCVENSLPRELTHLPGSQREGDLPQFAVVTGKADSLECLLRRMGIHDEEFTIPSERGAVHLYRENGVTLPNIPGPRVLFSSQDSLLRYDVVALDCEGERVDKPMHEKENLVAYANLGGRVVASHFSHTWLYDVAPFRDLAEWDFERGPPVSSLVTRVDTSFPKGEALLSWLRFSGAVGTEGLLLLRQPRHDLLRVRAPAQQWIYADTPPAPQQYTFNTPVEAPPHGQCGRVLYSNFHVTAPIDAQGGKDLFAACGKGPLSPQEKVLEFMLFDLASCLSSDQRKTLK